MSSLSWANSVFQVVINLVHGDSLNYSGLARFRLLHTRVDCVSWSERSRCDLSFGLRGAIVEADHEKMNFEFPFHYSCDFEYDPPIE